MSYGNLDRIAKAISYIPSADRDLWVRIAMSVKSLVGEDGFSIWDTWSQAAESYNEKDAASVWKSCAGNGAITGGTLFHEAKQHGWIDDEKIPPSPRQNTAASREISKDDAQAQAASKAALMWQRAKPAPGDHAYLAEKKIQPHGVRAHLGTLFVPMYDDTDTLCSVQIITANEAGAVEKFQKKYLVHSRVAGCFFMIGDLGEVLCIAEGFATAASIHEATGHAVCVAFSVGNIGKVAKVMRQRYPNAKIIIAADDDRTTEKNPGLRDATQAAKNINGLLAVPDFGGDRPEGATDFNDLAQHIGKDAVQRAIADARAPESNNTSSAANASTPSGTANTDWPVLEDAMLYGLAGDIVRAIAPHTEADPAALLLQTLIAFGSLIGRGCHVKIDGAEHHANLYGVLVGKSSKSRKGTSWARVLELFSPIHDWCKVPSGLSSGEGLKYHVRDRWKQ